MAGGLFFVFSPSGMGVSLPDPAKLINKFLFNFFGVAGYVGVFVTLVACGLGLPFPEDVPLITGGMLAAMGPPKGVDSLPLMMIVGLLGILVGDSIIFKAGNDYGDALLNTWIGKHIPAKRVDETRELFRKHGPKLIMVARFIPGLRAVTYFVAGTSHIRYFVFLTYDGIAALVSAPLWVYLGYWAGKNHALKRVHQIAKQFQFTLLGILAVVGLFFLVRWLLQRKREAQARSVPPPPLAAALPVPTDKLPLEKVAEKVAEATDVKGGQLPPAAGPARP